MGTNTSANASTIPWSNHAPLSAVELDPDTVGFHAMVKTVQDPSPLPVHARERTIVPVTDFGADPTGAVDSAAAVHSAIMFAENLGAPATITFPPGRYTMYPEGMPKRELYVSNTVGRFCEYKEKNIGILLEDMADVILDGPGSELIFHGRATQFAAIRSSDVTIRNLRTDWHAPLVLDLTVVASGVTNATIRNNVFDRPTAGRAAIWFDPTSAESEPERTVHSNISIDANRFMLLPGGSLVAGKSVAGLTFSNNVVGHYGPTIAAPAGCDGALFSFSASRGLRFAGNEYASGLNQAVAIADMQAGEVDCTDDGVTARAVGAADHVAGAETDAALLATLAQPRWTGVDFGQASSPLAWLTHAPAGTTQVCVTLVVAEPATSVHINYNDARIVTAHDGSYTLELLSGPNILEVRTLAEGGCAGQTYRWVVIAA